MLMRFNRAGAVSGDNIERPVYINLDEAVRKGWYQSTAEGLEHCTTLLIGDTHLTLDIPFDEFTEVIKRYYQHSFVRDDEDEDELLDIMHENNDPDGFL